MLTTTMTIERLRLPADEKDLDELASLLVDAVDSGAAVSFMAPLSVDEARAWWRRVLAALPERAVVLVAREGDGSATATEMNGRDAGAIIGTVQLIPSWAPNQPHRGEVAKLLVHRRARGAGVGAALMRALDEHARSAGVTLLTLDAKRGAVAERLYQRLGWIVAGTIPDFALDPDGKAFHDTVIHYRRVPAAEREEGENRAAMSRATDTPRVKD